MSMLLEVRWIPTICIQQRRLRPFVEHVQLQASKPIRRQAVSACGVRSR